MLFVRLQYFNEMWIMIVAFSWKNSANDLIAKSMMV